MGEPVPEDTAAFFYELVEDAIGEWLRRTGRDELPGEVITATLATMAQERGVGLVCPVPTCHEGFITYHDEHRSSTLVSHLKRKHPEVYHNLRVSLSLAPSESERELRRVVDELRHLSNVQTELTRATWELAANSWHPESGREPPGEPPSGRGLETNFEDAATHREDREREEGWRP